jgi:hypothetical protein
MSTMTRLAEARPEVATRPRSVVPPGERAALLRSITGVDPIPAPYVGEGEAVGLAARQARPRRPLLLAAAAVVVLAALAVGLARRGGDDVEAPAAPPSAATALLPAGFDPATASPVFSAPSDVNAVLSDYLFSRWGHAQTTLTVTEDRGDLVTASWQLPEDPDEPVANGWEEGVLASGEVFARRIDGRWSVVGSSIDGVQVVGGQDGDRLRGTVTSSHPTGRLVVDVLTPAGRPVPGGHVEAVEDPAVFDVPVDGPVVLRVQLVDEVVLGVAEVAVDAPPVTLAGSGGPPSWWVRAQQRADGWCVGLATGHGQVCTSAADQLWPDGVWYLSLGPSERQGDTVLVTGFVNPAVASVQVRRADGSELDVPTSRSAVGPGVYLVLLVPVVDGPVTIDLQAGDGRVLDTVELAGLLPIGG